MAKKKRSLKKALEPEKKISEELPDPLDVATQQGARFAEIKDQIKALEKEAKTLKAEFEPVVKPLAENNEVEHKGVRFRWTEVTTQSVKPIDFYELAGDDGLQFLTVSVPKAKKAIESGTLGITQEELDEIASSSSYERLEVKIVSAEKAAELFDIPF